jgi:riboflavin kinase/FMN adenylyltransferase
VTNIGVRPTLYENYGITIESHILDFDSNVYGDTVRLYFHRLLRREHQFQSAVELTNQIRMDIETSRRYFLRHPVRFDEAGYSFP